MPLAGPSAEVVVADAVVTDAPFLADPTGTRDSTQAFTDALAAVSAYGGGTVFAPAGIYRIDGTLFIPGSTTLRGADLRDRSDPNRIGTLLLASFGEGDETAASFISLRLLACVRDLRIWYPSQGFTNDTVRPYPFTVSFDDCCASALNLRLYNSYDGIAVRTAATTTWPTSSGPFCTRASRPEAATSIPGSPTCASATTPGNRLLAQSFPTRPRATRIVSRSTRIRRAHLLGAQIGLNTYGMYGLRVRDAHHGMLVKKLPGDPEGFSASFPRSTLRSKMSMATWSGPISTFSTRTTCPGPRA